MPQLISEKNPIRFVSTAFSLSLKPQSVIFVPLHTMLIVWIHFTCEHEDRMNHYVLFTSSLSYSVLAFTSYFTVWSHPPKKEKETTGRTLESIALCMMNAAAASETWKRCDLSDQTSHAFSLCSVRGRRGCDGYL